MTESKCIDCQNALDVDYNMGGIFACIYSSRVETGLVRRCNYFKPKRDIKGLGSLAPEQKAEMEKKPVKERNETCPLCNGRQNILAAKGLKECPVCAGKGYKPKAKNMRS